jgi:hypothetical protein
MKKYEKYQIKITLIQYRIQIVTNLIDYGAQRQIAVPYFDSTS